MPEAKRRFHSLSDADLLELLYTAADRLPRDVVDELLGRGPRMIAPLASIVMDKTSWTQPLPQWWAAVHATYVLGAMENPDTLVPLLTALRWADAFDCDWVTEDLPSMFGRLGRPACEPLFSVVGDPTAGWGARAVALSSLASLALGAPYLADDVIDLGAQILADRDEDLYLRQAAANVLLDFRASRHRDLLVAFGKEESERQHEDPDYRGVFYDWEVDDFLGEGENTQENLDYYRRDWLAFYDPEETDRRQERWRREQEEAAEEIATPDAPAQRLDLQGPCPCGSGRPFEHCCYLRVH